jgi:hypothetical protein
MDETWLKLPVGSDFSLYELKKNDSDVRKQIFQGGKRYPLDTSMFMVQTYQQETHGKQHLIITKGP